MATGIHNPDIDKRLVALDALLKSERPKSVMEALCIQRLISDFENEGKNGLRWNEDEAVRAVKFSQLMCHWKGRQFAGKPFKPEPWQEHCILAPLFGWHRELDGELVRRFNEGYCEIPRKNGKTFTSSVIGSQGLVADGEEGPEVYSAATTRDQATICFRDAQNSLRQSPRLLRHVKVLTNAISCPENNGTFQPVSADYNFLQGKNPYRVIIDELHAHRNRDVYDALITGMGARRNALMFSITTAGYDRTSICWDRHEFARTVLEGIIDEPTFFCYIACAEPEDDFHDPMTWWKANPNLGISITRDYLDRESRKAKSAAAENTFRRLHLNQWTQQAVRWIQMHEWDACQVDFSEEEMEGRKCYAGLDLASTRDVNALVLLFPMGDRYRVLPYFWIPEASASTHAENDKREVLHWMEEGWITGTEGNVSDFDGQIPEDIMEISRRFDVLTLCYDPWGSAPAVMQKLENLGFPSDRIEEFRQTLANFAGPTKEFERLIASRKLEHNGHPVLRWMASNVAVKPDVNGNIRPDKAASSQKIDGIVAGCMALGAAMSAEPAQEEPRLILL